MMVTIHLPLRMVTIRRIPPKIRPTREKNAPNLLPDASPSTTEIAPGVILGGPLPHGATISTTTPGAVIVRVKCHGLHATAMVTRPTLPSGATPSFVDAKHAVSVDAPSSPAAHSRRVVPGVAHPLVPRR